MTDWVTVPDSLVKEALSLAASYLERSRPEDTSDYPVELIDGLIAHFKEAGGCDHSVGICCCAEEDAVAELLLAKDGKLICRDCGGDGYLWSREKYEAAVAKAKAENFGYDVSEGEGNIECMSCDGRGIARIKTALHKT